MREQSGAWLRLVVSSVDPGEIPHQWSHHRVSSRLRDSKLGGQALQSKQQGDKEILPGEIPSSRLWDSKHIKPETRKRSCLEKTFFGSSLLLAAASQLPRCTTGIDPICFQEFFVRSSINMYWFQIFIQPQYETHSHQPKLQCGEKA